MKYKLKLLDYPILFILLCFLVISTAVIYSATSGTSFQGLHMNNAITFSVLFVVMILLSLLDYRVIVNHFSVILYIIGVLLMILVVFKGISINGSKRWINLGMAFQPSEIMKIFVILLLAKMMKRREGQKLRLLQDLIPMFIIVLVPFLFVLEQPDLGTSIVFICIFLGMLWIGNVRLLHALSGLVLLVVLIGTLTAMYLTNSPLFSKIIKPHQLKRIQTFINPTADPDSNWHVLNSIKAIASGSLDGEGFKHGNLVQGGFIPYDYADSIFVVIGEEFGFIGASVLLLLYFVLIYRLIRIAIDCPDIEGTYVIIGIISMFTLQIFENIAMHIGLMPLTGIALPFVSYGGDSLLTNMISMSLVLSVKMHRI
ncbi:FtsW/RodA/SpoVE family cell cycle protein [Paenibacillus sp. P25]|nr:FtsW/RodA/SpoVE family cell cycle protein [Paenibacillus sp. P25]